MDVKVVIFDLGSVYYFVDWIKINKEMMEKLGISTLVRSSGNKYIIDLYNKTNEGKISTEEFFKVLSKGRADYKEVIAYYKDCYKRNQEIDERIVNLVAKLRKRYKVACLTDTNSIHSEANKERGIFNNFDFAFTSFEIGSVKTDVKTYKKVLSKLGVVPGEAIFIDDHDENVETAISIGLNAIKYENFEKLVRDLKNFGIVI